MSIFKLLCSFLLSLSVQAAVSNQYKVLRFSNDGYIQFRTNMRPFANKMSVCSWIRDLGSNYYPTIFSYGHGNMLRLQSNGNYNCMASQCYLHVGSELHAEVSKGSWFPVCITWSTASRSLKYYAKGQLLGNMTTDDRALPSGHKIVLGNHAGVLSNNYAFAGEMLGLNVYSKELTAEEVKKLSDAGMCSTEDDENEDVRLLKWEDLLKKPRTGTVTEFDAAELCNPSEIESRLKETEQKLKEKEEQLSNTQQELNKTAGQLKYTQQVLNGNAELLNITQQTLNWKAEQLNNAQQELEEVSRNLNRTTGELLTVRDQLDHCNKTNFFSGKGLNQKVFNEAYEQLHSRLDGVKEYPGQYCANAYTKSGGCDGWRSLTKEICIQLCLENKTPHKTKCPVPIGGCRYAFWNETSQWCHLIGRNCDMEKAAGQKTVIDTMYGVKS